MNLQRSRGYFFFKRNMLTDDSHSKDKVGPASQYDFKWWMSWSKCPWKILSSICGRVWLPWSSAFHSERYFIRTTRPIFHELKLTQIDLWRSTHHSISFLSFLPSVCLKLHASSLFEKLKWNVLFPWKWIWWQYLRLYNQEVKAQ